MINKILLTFILGMFLTSFSSGAIQTLGTFELNKDIVLVQTCDLCNYNNVSYVLLPNSTIIKINSQMTKDGTFYNFTLDKLNVQVSGEYIINGLGDLNGDGANKTWNYNLFVNPLGDPITVSTALIYLVTLAGALMVFSLSLYFSIMIPWVNKRGEEGKVISVNKLKYIKLGLMPISYALFNWILNILLLLSRFLENGVINSFFSFMFTIFINLAYPLAIVWGIIFMLAIKNDAKISKTLRFRP